MTDLTKGMQRKARKFAELAYRRELDRALTALDAHFAKWRTGDLTPWDLSESIHAYHDGVSRDLYVRYTRGIQADNVARAIVAGILAESEVDDDLLDVLGSAIEFHRDVDRRQS